MSIWWYKYSKQKIVLYTVCDEFPFWSSCLHHLYIHYQSFGLEIAAPVLVSSNLQHLVYIRTYPRVHKYNIADAQLGHPPYTIPTSSLSTIDTNLLPFCIIYPTLYTLLMETNTLIVDKPLKLLDLLSLPVHLMLLVCIVSCEY